VRPLSTKITCISRGHRAGRRLRPADELRVDGDFLRVPHAREQIEEEREIESAARSSRCRSLRWHFVAARQEPRVALVS